MPIGNVKGKADEELWARAKEVVKNTYKKVPQGTPRYFKLVSDIYKKLSKTTANAPKSAIERSLQ